MARLVVALIIIAAVCAGFEAGRQPVARVRCKAQEDEDAVLLASLAAKKAALDAAMSASLHRAAIVARAEGCWAGREVTFSPTTGMPEPLDASYLDPELREWGEPPVSWELFSREERETWKRTAFRVEPEAGCAADEVAVLPASTGVDFGDAQFRSIADVHLVDTRRYPSGETCATLIEAPPFVEARTLFYDGLAAVNTNRTYDRLRLDLKLDPSRATLLRCSLVAERRLALEDSPFATPLKPGSRRAAGFDATTVASLCGPCFAERSANSVNYTRDGATAYSLLDDAIRITLAPAEGPAVASTLDLSVRVGDTYACLRRSYDARGTLRDVFLQEGVVTV